MSTIKVIAGLGNPGTEYARTRHNIGFWALDALAQEGEFAGADGSGVLAKLKKSFGSSKKKQGAPTPPTAFKTQRKFRAAIAEGSLGGNSVTLIKPLTFMNLSGEALAAYMRYKNLKPENFAAVYDDYTLELGRVKITTTGSAGGHNGIKSLLAHLGPGFTRYRIGIGPKTHPSMVLTDFVLGKFTQQQQTELNTQLPTYCTQLSDMLR